MFTAPFFKSNGLSGLICKLRSVTFGLLTACTLFAFASVANATALTVNKSVSGAPASGAPGAYVMSVSCGAPNAGPFVGTVNLVGNALTGSTSVNVPVGAFSCLVTETAVPTPPAGFLWDTVNGPGTFDVTATGPVFTGSTLPTALNVRNSLYAPITIRYPESEKYFSNPGLAGTTTRRTTANLGETLRVNLVYVNKDLPLSNRDYYGVGFDDALPSGMVVPATPNLSVTGCGAAVTSFGVNGGTFGFSQGNVFTNSACVVGFDVVLNGPFGLGPGQSTDVVNQIPQFVYSVGENADVFPALSATVRVTSPGLATHTVTVNKAVTGAPATGAPGTYAMSIACDAPNAGPFIGTVNLAGTAITGTTTITVPAGAANCAVTEPSKPTAPAGYNWSAPVLPVNFATTAGGTNTVVITNPLTASFYATPVTKILSDAPSSGVPGAYVMSVYCRAPNEGPFVGTVNLIGAALTGSTFINLPVGARFCTLNEVDKPTPPGVFRWYRVARPQAFDVTANGLISSASGLPVAPDVTNYIYTPVDIRNVLTEKYFSNPGINGSATRRTTANIGDTLRVNIVYVNTSLPSSNTYYSNFSFNDVLPTGMVVSATPNLSVKDCNATTSFSPDSRTFSLLNALIPSIGACVVGFDVVLNGPFGLAPGQSTDVVNQIPAAEYFYGELTGEYPTLSATVRVTSPGLASHTVTVSKAVTGAPATGAPGAYAMSIACDAPNAGPFTGTVNLAGTSVTGTTTITLPAGAANCAVTEPSKPTAPAGYSWSAPVLPANFATTAGGTNTVVVTNPLGGVIDAVDDVRVVVSAASANINILGNDTLRGAPVTASALNISIVNAGGLSNLTIDSNGNLVVPANAAPGSYVVTYKICEKLAPANCDTAIVPIVVQGYLTGSVWLDNGAGGTGASDRQRSVGEAGLQGWTIEVVYPTGHPQAGQVVALVDVRPARVQTDADGQYRISGLPPGNYRLRFYAPTGAGSAGAAYGTPVNGEQGNPQSGALVNYPARSLDITMPAGAGLAEQSLPVDPSGVVYDSITRQPITNATVTLLGPNGQPVPASQLLPAQQDQAVVPSGPAAGTYRFDLLPAAPSGVYTIRVNPGAGYTAPSTLIAPTAGPGTPGSAGLCVGVIGACLIQAQAEAPKVGQDTRYYLSFTITPGVTQDIVHNHIPLDPAQKAVLAIVKSVDKVQAGIGDPVKYTIRVKNLSNALVPSVIVQDTLPLGFKYIPNTTRSVGTPPMALANPAGGVGPVLTFNIGNLQGVAPGNEVQFTYVVRLGTGAADGDGINRAFAASGAVRSLTAQAKVKVNGGVFTREACVIGKVYADCGVAGLKDSKNNAVQEAGEPGIPGVRLFLQDASSVVTDGEGKYSICGLKATTHVLKLDSTTLPPGAKLGVTANRNGGDADSLFIDLKFGELHRADFTEISCSPALLDEVKRRRGASQLGGEK